MGCVARALGIMAVTFAEATRFWPYHQKISNNCALMISEQEGGSWNSHEADDLRRETRIGSRDNALDALRVALNLVKEGVVL